MRPPTIGEDPRPRIVASLVRTRLAARGLSIAPDARNRFETQELLGLGASAAVWGLVDHDLNRDIAVKVLNTEGAASAQEVERFLDEARIAASLSHPNVLPVHDVGLTAEAQPFISMPRIHGSSLESILATSSLERRSEPVGSIDAVLGVFINVCQALSHAHRRGFVHQDVKPANVVVGDLGEVTLVDWGSACRPGDCTPVQLYGTPLYMSPEQARLEGVDVRSDIYCVGASLLHALILRVPLWSDHADEFWRRKRLGEYDRPSPTERGRVGAGPLAIAAKAMRPDPGGRYQSAEAMLLDLRACLSGQPIMALPEPIQRRLLRLLRRNRRLVLVSVFAALAILVVASALLIERRKLVSDWQVVYDRDFSSASDRPLWRDWTMWASNYNRRPRQIDLRGDPTFSMHDGALYARSANDIRDISFLQPVVGDLRVEWDMTPLEIPDDLNCFIGGVERNRAYIFHIGGWGNPRYCKLSKGSDADALDETLLSDPLRIRQTYHFFCRRSVR